MNSNTRTNKNSVNPAASTPAATSALLNTISPPFPLAPTSSFPASESPASISELLDLARKTPLPPSSQSSPHKNPSIFNSATKNAVRGTWSSRLSVSDQLLLSSAADSRSHSTSPSTRASTVSRQVQFQIQDHTAPIKLAASPSTMPTASALPSGLSVLNASPSSTRIRTTTDSTATKNGLASSSPTRSSSPSTSPTSRGRIVHRSLSPASRAQQPGKSARSPIRPLSKARVPKGSPSLLVRAFDAFTQSILFSLGLAFLVGEFIYAQVRSVFATAAAPHQPLRSSRSSRSPRRNLQAKLDTIALWPPIGLGWFVTSLQVLESKCGPWIGRAAFAMLVLAVGPSYVGMVVGLSIPLALVKALSQQGSTIRRPVGLPADTGHDGRGRQLSRSS